jgi:hypothetical protein
MKILAAVLAFGAAPPSMERWTIVTKARYARAASDIQALLAVAFAHFFGW